MGISIKQSLQRVLTTTTDVNTIIITDQDGVPIITEGEKIRYINTLTNAFATALEQGVKLGLGDLKSWTFVYETQQVVVLARAPFQIYILATPEANTIALTTLIEGHLKPILLELESVYRQVNGNKGF
uniref:Robl_LC7 domain-containing protein n=1 Tax=Panagrellus redivivus TaxID=6233 RepID=A0A7E4VWN1_PANRE